MAAEQTSGTTEAQDNPIKIDDWASAFEYLEPKGKETPAADADTGNPDVGGHNPNADTADGQDASQAESGNGNADENLVGGLDLAVGADEVEGGESDSNAFAESFGITEESIQQYEQELDGNIRDRAINEVAQEFIKRGVRNNNGRLGATLDDPDICKRDSDGAPRFYNPETGREFTGDNPRRQAQEWIDDYNKELARVFNNTCAEYEQHLKQESAPQLAVMKFAPKYEQLDEIRRGMLDNAIEGYEIKDDNGKIIGYSCDLDKALELVNRQVSMIQNYAKQHAQQQQQPENKPTGPALDMKTSSGGVQTGAQPAAIGSLAEAMERLQDAQLAKLKKN